MPHIVELPNGETAEFPDEMSPDQISSVISSHLTSNSMNEKNNQFKNMVMDSTPNPLEVIKSGLLGLGKAGENVASTVTGGYAPKAIDEVTNIMGGNKYPLVSKVAQYAPGILALPEGLLGQAAAGAGYQASQSPENPVLGAAEGAIGAPLGKAIPPLAKGIKSILTKIAPKELSYGIQRAHDKLMSQASDIYDFIKSEVKPRGVNKIDIPSEVIDQAESALSKTRANKMLVDKARSGDYESLHQLQSDLGKLGRKKLGSDTVAENNEGEEILDNRAKINEHIRDKFKEYGHEDLAKLLDEAQSKWAKLKDTYYSHPAIAKLVGEETRKIPSNPIKTFSEESKPMGKLLSAHPEVAQAVKTSNEAKAFMKSLKNVSKVGLGSFGAYEGYNLLKLLKDNLSSKGD